MQLRQSSAVRPRYAEPAQPRYAEAVRQRHAPAVEARPSRPVEIYQSREAHRYTKEEFARMDEQSRRIAAQRSGNVAPGANHAAQQLYWQQQLMHRTTEAYNPDVTYYGR